MSGIVLLFRIAPADKWHVHNHFEYRAQDRAGLLTLWRGLLCHSQAQRAKNKDKNESCFAKSKTHAIPPRFGTAMCDQKGQATTSCIRGICEYGVKGGEWGPARLSAGDAFAGKWHLLPAVASTVTTF